MVNLFFVYIEIFYGYVRIRSLPPFWKNRGYIAMHMSVGLPVCLSVGSSMVSNK